MTGKIIVNVAVYEYLSTGSLSSLQGMKTVCLNSRDDDTDMIRITDFKDVEFIELTKDQTLPLVINSIDKKIDDIKKKAIEEISRFEQQRSELLAIGSDSK